MKTEEKDSMEMGDASPVERAEEFIRQHYAEEFKVDKVADALFINKSYLMRIFKEYTGITLLQYLNTIRCKKAEELLQNTNLTIESIAFKVGYATASHFTRVFKQINGQTPLRYRRMMKRKERQSYNNDSY